MNPVRVLLGVFVYALAALSTWAAPAQKPNIIFILTDDQGYGDISAHGNPTLRTPNLDRLRSEAARFTDFHVSPTCAPTRSALMTGRHEFKNGVTHTIFERERMTLSASTLPELLQKAGYTTGIFGKWHLGDEAEYRPDKRGFDEVFIHGGGGVGQTYPGSCGDAPGNTYFNPAILHNGTFVKTEGFCTDVFFAQATRWIDRARQRGPFFAYIATNAPHSPYTARPQDAELYRGKTPDEAVANFFGMLHNIDENVGGLLKRIDEWGIGRDTVVIFMNDNGGTAGTRVFNAGMRAQKGTPYLGGTRASSFWRWPGQFVPRDIPVLAAHIDFLPTIAEIVAVPLAGKLAQQVEGRSLLPLLRNNSPAWPERTLFTHVGRWPRFSDPGDAKYANCSVRVPRWHMVSTKAPAAGAKPAWELYDVAADISEQNNVADRHPEVVAKLSAEYDAWWRSIQPALVNEKAVGPRINPFKEIYWKQFGGGPTKEELYIMEPNHATIPSAKGAKQKKK